MTLTSEGLEQLAAMPSAARMKILRSLPSADAKAYLDMTGTSKEARLVKAIVDGMAPTLRTWMAQSLEPLLKRIAELEKSQVRFCGVWRDGGDYRKGDLVIHAGALWHGNVDDARGQPGKSSEWTLAVKSGSVR